MGLKSGTAKLSAKRHNLIMWPGGRSLVELKPKTAYASYTELTDEKQTRPKDQGWEQNIHFARSKPESVG